jgi:pilus assembly protein CpaD
MSSNAPQRRASVRLAGWLALAGLAAAPLAGCGLDYGSTDPIVANDYHLRHPIILAEAPSTLDVYPVGGGLDAQSQRSIRAFAERYRAYGEGRITILAPADQRGRDRAIVDAIRRTLASAGLRGAVGVGFYPPGDPRRAEQVRLIFEGLKAEVPTACGQWPTDLASGGSVETWKNDQYPNFGCATQAALAAQVADPRDFAQARAIDPPDVNMRMRAINNVHSGQDPGTNWKIQITPIGQVGSGG